MPQRLLRKAGTAPHSCREPRFQRMANYTDDRLADWNSRPAFPSTREAKGRQQMTPKRPRDPKQGRLIWLRNLIQPRSTSILKIPRKRPRPTARWTEILWPVWLAHFRRQTRSAPRNREARVHADRFSGKKKRPQRGATSCWLRRRL